MRLGAARNDQEQCPVHGADEALWAPAMASGAQQWLRKLVDKVLHVLGALRPAGLELDGMACTSPLGGTASAVRSSSCTTLPLEPGLEALERRHVGPSVRRLQLQRAPDAQGELVYGPASAAEAGSESIQLRGCVRMASEALEADLISST